MDAPGPPPRFAPLAWDEGQVGVLNCLDVPTRFTRARVPVPVVARVEWASPYGVEHIPTLAVGWTRERVLVELSDRRCTFRGLWLAPVDVERQ